MIVVLPMSCNFQGSGESMLPGHGDSSAWWRAAVSGWWPTLLFGTSSTAECGSCENENAVRCVHVQLHTTLWLVSAGSRFHTHTHTHIYIYNGFAQIGSSQNHILSFPGKLYKSIHFFGYIRFSKVPHVKTCKAKQNVLAGVLDFSAHSKNQQSLERTMERWNHFFLVGAICPNSPHLLLSLVEEVPRIRSPPFALWFLRGGKRCIYI